MDYNKTISYNSGTVFNFASNTLISGNSCIYYLGLNYYDKT